jgi:chitinase
MISFDDPQSFAAKGRFVEQNNLAGYAMWEAGGDSKDMLITAVRNSAGL